MITKQKAPCLHARYNTAKTNPLLFCFEPSTCENRLKRATIQHHTVEGKEIYCVDQFFTQEEAEDLRRYSEGAQFSRAIFAHQESREQGEKPARAMSPQEKWLFFSNPPQAVLQVYQWLGLLSTQLGAVITTLPWELYDGKICAPAVATNWVTTQDGANQELGKHRDYDTETGVGFGIPMLYASGLHPDCFMNGSEGRPWLVSLMLYATSENFLPQAGLGTAFYHSNGEMAVRLECRHMRFILFEGDLLHSIAAATSDLPMWRISYVFKLVINPKHVVSMKKVFSELIYLHA